MLSLPQAELRVYEPLSAFPDAAQSRLLRARHLSREQVERTAQRRSRARLLRDVTDPFPHGEDLVRVLRVPAAPMDGVGGEAAGLSEFYCPDELGLRAELAAVELEGTLRSSTFSLLVPEAARQANLQRVLAQAELTGRLQSADPDEQLQVRTRTAVWGVPVPWFLLFDTEDHLVVVTEDGPESDAEEAESDEADPVSPQAPTVSGARRTTSLTAALERARRAVVVMSLHAPGLDLVDEVTTLIDWLQAFHPDAHVELDYGALAPLVWPDDSVFDVQTAVDALEDGDVSSAVLAHHRLMRRWLGVRLRGRAS